jgi:hypothetical protein
LRSCPNYAKNLGRLRKLRNFSKNLGTLEDSSDFFSRLLKVVLGQFGNSLLPDNFCQIIKVEKISFLLKVLGTSKNPDAPKDSGEKIPRMLKIFWAVFEYLGCPRIL